MSLPVGRAPWPIGANLRTFLVENVLQVGGLLNAFPNMQWGQGLKLALMGPLARLIVAQLLVLIQPQ